MDLKFPIEWGNEKTAFVRFQAKNMGFAYLYEPQKTYRFDTTINYSGLTLDELTEENNILNNKSDEILDTLGIRSGKREKLMFLPGYVEVGKIVDNHNNAYVQPFFGVRVYPSSQAHSVCLC